MSWGQVSSISEEDTGDGWEKCKHDHKFPEDSLVISTIAGRMSVLEAWS